MHLDNLDNIAFEYALQRWNERLTGFQFENNENLATILDLLQKAIGKAGSSSATSLTSENELAHWIEEILNFPSHRLAVYGSLAPGAENHWVLSDLSGIWSKGTIRGHHDPAGWGYTNGFPAVIWDPSGNEIVVQVFDSRDLPQHWERIDEFEGSEYRRILVPVRDSAGVIVANIYALTGRSDCRPEHQI